MCIPQISINYIYLAGTRDGFIHLCSVFRPYFLETYEKHFLPVNSIEWSPFSPDLFLSCSSDWTVQLWRRDNPKPILGFSSSQTAVYGVRWSPKWPTVFAALKAEQLEIWDLKISILDPALVLKAGAVEFTSVQFCSEADTVVVGDTHGEVKVHQLHNLGVGSDGQVNNTQI
uniref:Dynein axonemal intermediate chain 4 n=1 Tax=Periophthalmus magnuspinnatus TaxID=409849 RepID=A0A3B4B688_9GOBI